MTDTPKLDKPLEGGSSPVPCSASSLTGEQVEILKHTLKNGRYCGGGKDTEALTAAGLMHYLGTPAWCPDPFYAITEAGKAAIRRQNARDLAPPP